VSEPASPEAVATWIADASRRQDPFEDVRRASHEHRVEHGFGCTVYPSNEGPLLRVLASAVRAKHVLEIGTGLGYSTLCLAADGARVKTIERDPVHAELAGQNLAAHGVAAEVVVGRALDVVPQLDGAYDLVFCDADPVGYESLLDELHRVLRLGGLLVSANLFLAQFADGISGLDELARYRDRLLGEERFRTAFVPGGMTLSVRVG
jgi:predicted O-methyltransferase YrrM